jgi:hypothetical protein
MKKITCVSFLCLFWLCLQTGSLQAAVNAFDKPVLHPAIPLVDDTGQHVLTSGKPYSTRASCGGGSGGCHDIDKISHAYHFEMGRDEAADNYGVLRKLPALVSPGYFGGFDCMGKNNPQWLSKKTNASANEFLDYGAPGLLKACGECHSGGGFAEKGRSGERYDQVIDSAIKNLDGDHYDWQDNQLVKWNWKTSGVMENDCLICHADLTQLKNSPANVIPNAGSGSALDNWSNLRTNLILANGLFRYADSAIFAFLNVKPDSASGQTLVSIAANGNGEPKLTWNPAGFDENGKMEMPMLRFPASENCMICHKTSHERRGFYGFGAEAANENSPDGSLTSDYRDDAHKGRTWTENGESRDIENCNACHSKQYYKAAYKNIDIDADHNFPMGNGDMDVRRDLNYQPKPLSCEHCHNGPSMGGAENPALPSGQANVLDAHRELWKGRGDMVGYPSNTLNRTVQVHFDAIACQTCHITGVKFDGKPLPVRYRYRKDETGRLKMVPYNPASRYYWADKVSGRVVSQRERLTVETAKPQTYDQIKALKAQFDQLLQNKGYKNADTQMIWTESNEYLITHNTRVSVQAMICDECHDRKQNGSVSSIVKDGGILGIKNQRTVAQLNDGGYTRLVNEGIVKLDMPYFKVSSDGKIVENVSDILYETKIDPFQSALRLSSAPVTDGEFRLTSRDEALTALNLANDALVVSALTAQTGDKVFWFNNATAGDRVKDVALLVAYNNTSKNIVPNYRLEVAADDWNVLYAAQQPPTKKKPKNKKPSTAPEDNVSSSVLRFVLSDQQKQQVASLGGSKMMVKLPYFGRATDAAGVGLYAIEALKTGKFAPLASHRLVMDVVSVVPGNTATPGYVLANMNELPQQAVLADIKTTKKGK